MAPVAAFGDFQLLERLVRNFVYSPLFENYCLDILLDFNMGILDFTCRINMEAIELVSATGYLDDLAQVHMSFYRMRVRSIRLGTLRRRLFVFLIELMESSPHHCFSSVPTVSMDALGRMRSAEFILGDGSKEVIINSRVNLNGEDLAQAAAKASGEMLANILESSRQRWASSYTGTLLGFIGVLDRMY